MAEYIDRANLIARIEYYVTHTPEGKGEHYAYSVMLNEVLNCPAADVVPSPDWIPADEELPPNGQEVLCWYEYFRFGQYNRMYQTFGVGYQFNGNWGGEVAQGRNAKVLAWIPLPEPPEMDGGAE